MTIKIEIPGEPIAKERAYSVHKDKDGNALPFIRHFNRQENEDVAFKWAVMKYMTENHGGVMSIIETGPIAMGFIFIMPVRKNWPQYKIRDLQRGMTFYHFVKPDTDNLIKFCKDCLQGICYKNDSQVAVYDPPPMKIYGFEPRTIITIRKLPEFEMVKREGYDIPVKPHEANQEGINFDDFINYIGEVNEPI